MGKRAFWGLTEQEKLIDFVMKNALLWKTDHPDDIKKIKLTMLRSRLRRFWGKEVVQSC